MGEIAEAMLASIFDPDYPDVDEDDEYPSVEWPVSDGDGLWATREGHVIEIRAMTDAHLTNAIAWVERNGFGKEPKVRELKAEQRRRARRMKP